MYQRKRPRALTLTLSNSKQPILMLGGKPYTLRNFSQEGVGLWVKPPDLFGLTPGAKVSGDVVIEKAIFPVKLEVRHCSPGLVGLQFTEINDDLEQLFRHMLEPSVHAARLKKHAKSQTPDPELSASRLWYAAEGTELLVWYNEFQKSVDGVQILWQGKWVFRYRYEKARTGFLRDDAQKRNGVRVLPEELVLEHQEADKELLHQAAQFLTSVPNPLPGHLLWQFLEIGEQVFLPEDIFKRSQVA